MRGPIITILLVILFCVLIAGLITWLNQPPPKEEWKRQVFHLEDGTRCITIQHREMLGLSCDWGNR